MSLSENDRGKERGKMEFGISWFVNYFIALGIISMAFVIPGACMLACEAYKKIKNRKKEKREV